MAKKAAAAKEVVGDNQVAGAEVESAQQVPPFVGNKDGVVVYAIEDGSFKVGFGFDRKLMSMMHEIPGVVHNRAESDKNAQIYDVPATSLQKLGMVVAGVRQEHAAIEADRTEIVTLATQSAINLQRDSGIVGIKPRLDDYIERATVDKPGKFYSGEIVNANTRFAAQFTGFGEQDGTAFVKLHRQSDLNQSVEKGARVGIVYGVNGRGEVSNLGKTLDERVSEFQNTAGRKVDGVTVTERGDKLGVAFEVNPALIARIKRIDGVAFNKEDKVWEVGADKADFVMRAVEDMRGIYAQEQKDIGVLTAIANDKIDGAKVGPAFSKEGTQHTGKVAATLGNYVLQKTAPEKFVLHHKDALDMKDLKPEQDLTIKYGAFGQGKVIDRDLEKAKGQALGGR